jgi:hypothetical protein
MRPTFDMLYPSLMHAAGEPATSTGVCARTALHCTVFTWCVFQGADAHTLACKLGSDLSCAVNGESARLGGENGCTSDSAPNEASPRLPSAFGRTPGHIDRMRVPDCLHASTFLGDACGMHLHSIPWCPAPSRLFAHGLYTLPTVVTLPLLCAPSSTSKAWRLWSWLELIRDSPIGAGTPCNQSLTGLM